MATTQEKGADANAPAITEEEPRLRRRALTEAEFEQVQQQLTASPQTLTAAMLEMLETSKRLRAERVQH